MSIFLENKKKTYFIEHYKIIYLKITLSTYLPIGTSNGHKQRNNITIYDTKRYLFMKCK